MSNVKDEKVLVPQDDCVEKVDGNAVKEVVKVKANIKKGRVKFIFWVFSSGSWVICYCRMPCVLLA